MERPKENSQEAVGHTQEGTPFQPGAYLPVGGAPGLEQPREPPTAQGRLDVIVEETTEMTVMTAEEAESEATPLGGPTGDATAPVRETEQDMETEGDGGNSPVTPNEDDLLTGAGAADVETGIASLHVDSPAKPGGNGDAATYKQARGETP